MKKLFKWFIYKVTYQRKEYRRVLKTDDLCSFMWDYEQYLRGQWKYDGEDDIEAIYEKWWEMKRDNGIDLDDLIE